MCVNILIKNESYTSALKSIYESYASALNWTRADTSLSVTDTPPRTWKREFKLPWREAGPPNHLDDKVDSDQ